MITISIALATYNGERFLRKQLDSLYTQTRLPDEVVVCDDCSTDGTVAILDEYKQRYGLKYIVNDQPLGVNGNFFRAISLCQGQYIGICDQDDEWFPNKIETLYQHIQTMDSGRVCAVSSMRQDVDADGTVLAVQQADYTEGWKATLLTYSRNQGCTMLFNRALWETIRPHVEENERALTAIYYDEWIAYSAALLGDKHNLPDVLMSYRHHDCNVVDNAVHYGKKTFRQKVHDLPTFYGFIPDERFVPLEIVYEAYREAIRDEKIIDCLERICRCNRVTGVWRKWGIILRMQCLTVKQRIVIGVKSACSILLKQVVK